MTLTDTATIEAGRDFIRDIIQDDLGVGRVTAVVTRFPPEPNGYLHIGHAKAISLNFGVAEEFRGRCHLRFDDTNPTKEEQEFIDAIKRDVHWLGFDWGEHLYYASDYFERLYEWAEYLIREGKAYVDDTPPDRMRSQRGTLTEPGQNSPDRYRSIEENLDLFRRMRAGEFPNGARVLRAKIDMASPNMNLRDPVLYRILHAEHPRTGNAWCIYPTYDYAHGQSDAIEGVTHSLCTLEFEDHRPLYDWLIDNLPVPARPHQYRIRAPQHRLHRDVEAHPDAAGERGPRHRLGRPAHAHTGWSSPSRHSCGSAARVRASRRYHQVEQHHGVRGVRVFRPRTAEPHRPAADGGAAPTEAGDRELARRPHGNAGGDQQSGGRVRRHATDHLRPGNLHRARRLHGEPTEEVLPARARAARCGCATATSSPAARR